MALRIEQTIFPESQPLPWSRRFFSPAASFAALRRCPRWGCPLLIAALYSAAVNGYLIWRIGFVGLLNTTLRASAAIDAQAFLETALEHKPQILFFQGLSTCAGIFFTAFVVALALWLVLEVIGDDLPFRRVLAVVAHTTMLIVLIRESMLALTATLMRNPENLDLRNPLATNLAFFIHPASPYVSRLLASLDLIVLGKACLLVIGLSKVSDNLSLRMACLAVVVPWGAYVGIALLFPGLL